MTWPWQRLRPSDELIPCTCGSTLPALPQAPLANPYMRNGRVIRINTGQVYQCLQCNQRFFVKTAGPGKGLIVIKREVPIGAVAQDIDYREAEKRLKQKLPLSIRDEMKDPPWS